MAGEFQTVTTPSGKRYRLAVPEGTTREQALAEALRQHPEAAQAKTSGAPLVPHSQIAPAHGALTMEALLRQAPYLALSLIPEGPMVSGAAKLVGPSLAKLAPAVIRSLGAAGIGAAEAPPGQRVEGALWGAGTQAGGEVVGGIGTRLLQRIGSRAFNRLSDQLATQLVNDAKIAVPWWSEVPSGQAGFEQLYKDRGTALLSQEYEKALRGAFQKANVPLPEGFVDPKKVSELIDIIPSPTLKADVQAAQSVYANGINFIKTMRASKALDPTTQRLNPENLVSGLAKASGITNPKTVWDRFLNRAPAVRESIKQTVPYGTRAPEVIGLPFIRLWGHHLSTGERVPIPMLTRGVPATGLEQAARQAIPSLVGSGARELLEVPPVKEEMR